jgi:SagB-type dehydrogenase family enzyme
LLHRRRPERGKEAAVMGHARRIAVALTLGAFLCTCSGDGKEGTTQMVRLPDPQLKGDVSVEEAIRNRRSRRSFTPEALTLEELTQVLWAAQGVTERGGRKRAAPSAGATYPMQLFVAVGANCVRELQPGIYRYLPGDHALEPRTQGDVRQHIAAAALGQDFLAVAPVSILMAADYERTTGRYGSRGVRYVAMEAGHIGQNIYLQAEALRLGTVAVGAFDDKGLAGAFRLPQELQALYLMPVGHTR